jgi:DNA-binding NarL/FixJ family response regulator
LTTPHPFRDDNFHTPDRRPSAEEATRYQRIVLHAGRRLLKISGFFVSPRTVQTHLTHVYIKLGVTSRVQLVQEAARHA